jgi:hypothetical protein
MFKHLAPANCADGAPGDFVLRRFGLVAGAPSGVRMPRMPDQWQAEATPEVRTRAPHAGDGSVQHGTAGQPKLPALYPLCMLRR